MLAPGMTRAEIEAFRAEFQDLPSEMEEALAFVSRPLEEQARVTDAIAFVSDWLLRHWLLRRGALRVNGMASAE
jgi:hypothetical protein